MTNLEKLKAEIAEMSAGNPVHTEIGRDLSDFICNQIEDGCRDVNCSICIEKWLNEESEKEK